MNEDKAARYHRLRRRALVTGAVWTVALPIILLATPASGLLRDGAVSASAVLPGTLAPVAAAVLFGAAVWVFHELLAFPAAHYLGFTLERRYGLSRQFRGRALADQARASALSLLFSCVAVAVVYAAIDRWPAWWWLAAWAAGVSASIGLTWLAPVVLMPLFFRLTPLDDAGLRERLANLSGRAGAPVLGIFEWRLSDRTRRGMAALTGLASTRRVLVSDTLVADYSPDEIEVVLAHELAHHVHRDLWKALAFEACVMGVGLWAASRLLPLAVPVLGLRGAGDPAGLPFLLLIAAAASAAVLPVANAVSRRHERRADAFALDLTRKPEAFVSAMRRLAAQNLAEESPSPVVRAFFYTHPPFDERLARARAWAQGRGTTRPAPDERHARPQKA